MGRISARTDPVSGGRDQGEDGPPQQYRRSTKKDHFHYLSPGRLRARSARAQISGLIGRFFTKPCMRPTTSLRPWIRFRWNAVPSEAKWQSLLNLGVEPSMEDRSTSTCMPILSRSTDRRTAVMFDFLLPLCLDYPSLSESNPEQASRCK